MTEVRQGNHRRRLFAAPQDVGVGASVWVTGLLDLPSTVHFGCARYLPGTAYFDGLHQPNSLITEVLNGTKFQRTQSTLTLVLGGRYERMTALLGRDDRLALQGPAYCYYEVYADGARVFRSEAIRSATAPVLGEGAFPKRKFPQPLDLSLRGVQSVKLVTRFCNEFTQTGRNVHRAVGCVWGGARLVTRDAVALGQTVSSGPLRDAVRRAVVDVLEAVPPPRGKAALRVGVPPVRIEAAPGTPLGGGDGEAALRADLTKQLTAIRRAGRATLAALGGADAEALAAALPVDGPARGNAATVAAVARGLRADLLAFGALARDKGAWRFTLRLVDTTKGATLKEASAVVGEKAAEDEP